jgi:glycogen synthase
MAQPELYPELIPTKTISTVYSLGFQCLFSHHDWYLLSLDQNLVTSRYLGFYGKINFLKGSLVFDDTIVLKPPKAAPIKTDCQHSETSA